MKLLSWTDLRCEDCRKVKRKILRSYRKELIQMAKQKNKERLKQGFLRPIDEL